MLAAKLSDDRARHFSAGGGRMMRLDYNGATVKPNVVVVAGRVSVFVSPFSARVHGPARVTAMYDPETKSALAQLDASISVSHPIGAATASWNQYVTHPFFGHSTLQARATVGLTGVKPGQTVMRQLLSAQVTDRAGQTASVSHWALIDVRELPPEKPDPCKAQKRDVC